MLPTSTEPAVADSRATLLRDPILVGAAGLGALALLHVHDPHRSGSYGYCPFLLVTGHPCPGCGGLRAMNDLTNGDVMGALSSNAMAVILLGVMGVAWVVWIYRRWRGQDVPLLAINSPVLWGLVIAFAVFGVFRWTPWGVWLRP
ncbi:MAG: DUF2752 domain-containing protein [Aeromicrobium sp.]